MELSTLLLPNRVRVPLAGTDKKAIITELIDLLAAAGGLTNRDAALEAVLKRESERSTGIGYGLAIPHGRTDGCNSLAMAAGKPANAIDFQSLDGRPVTFVVLLVSPPKETGPHIQALARISRLMNAEAFRAAVAQADSAPALLAAIKAQEARDAAG